MNHKRGRPKNARAGCLMCKPGKANSAKSKDKTPPRERRKLQPVVEEMTKASFRQAFETVLHRYGPAFKQMADYDAGRV